MTVEIGDRLASLRKAHGYSQEELADKIGVSRQAVSKWERTESSPDTDNLIALANLYGVSLDELVGISAGVDTSYASEKKSDDEVFDALEDLEDLKDDDDDNGEDDDSTIVLDLDGLDDAIKNKIKTEAKKSAKNRHVRGDRIGDTVAGITAVLAMIAYLVLGFTTNRGWAIGWTLFILIPVFGSLAEAIVVRDAEDFAFPILIAFTYLFGGMHWGLWHPYWIEFALIPIYYIIVELIKKAMGKNDDDDDYDDDGHIVKLKNKDGKVVISKDKDHVSVDVPGIKIDVENLKK